MPPIARGQTWLFQPLPVSTVPNTGRNQSDSGYRGLDEEEQIYQKTAQDEQTKKKRRFLSNVVYEEVLAK